MTDHIHDATDRDAARAEIEVRKRVARALFDLGVLSSPDHLGGCPADEPCECPEYVLVGALLNDAINIEKVEVAIAAAEEVES